jgi:CheY-like chemotaxis protein
MPDAKTHITILCVEDSALVRHSIVETLTEEGWRVETCADRRAARALIEGAAHYDLLLFDNGLPGASGLELTERVRQLRHRRCVPVVILSATNCAADARRAGADVFLLKPEGIMSLVEVVRRLLAVRGAL